MSCKCSSTWKVCFMTVVGLLLFSDPAAAQTRSLFGSQGSGGNSSSAAGATANSRNGSSVLGSTAGVSGNTNINTEAGATAVSTDFGTGLVGRSDNAGRFVGNQFATELGRGGASASSNRRFARSQTANTRSLGSTNRSSRSGNGSNLGTFRPQQKIAFAYVAPPTSAIGSVVTTRLDKIMSRTRQLRGLNLQINETGQVTLQGRVESAAARRLAENLVRLEPGVRSIRNELTVRATDSNK